MDEINIQVPIVVVVKESTAAPHRLNEAAFGGKSVDVQEIKSHLFGDIPKERLGGTEAWANQDEQDEQVTFHHSFVLVS